MIQERTFGRDVTFDIKAHQRPFRGGFIAFGQQGAAAGEMAFFPVDHPIQTHFKRRAGAIFAHGLMGGDEIHVGDDEASLDPGQVQRLGADGAQAMKGTRREQMVPQGQREIWGCPQLVSQIAGKAGAGNRQGSGLQRKACLLYTSRCV